MIICPYPHPQILGQSLRTPSVLSLPGFCTLRASPGSDKTAYLVPYEDVPSAPVSWGRFESPLHSRPAFLVTDQQSFSLPLPCLLLWMFWGLNEKMYTQGLVRGGTGQTHAAVATLSLSQRSRHHLGFLPDDSSQRRCCGVFSSVQMSSSCQSPSSLAFPICTLQVSCKLGYFTPLICPLKAWTQSIFFQLKV